MRSVVLLASLAACGGEGTVAVFAYGESFIEDGIPASEVGDGWALSFERFEVTLRDIRVAGVDLEDPPPVDLTGFSSGSGHELGRLTAEEGAHSGASFTIASVAIEGSATRGADTKSFAWDFEDATAYSACETETDVEDGGTADFQITVHADHLLYDSLVAAEPQLLFDALAGADANADGEITEAELAATGIGAYDPGSEGGIDDLWSYLVALSRTLGHVDGEGHCEATPSSS